MRRVAVVTRIVLAVAAPIAAFALLLAIPAASSIISPLVASPIALYSSIAIYLGSVGMALLVLVKGWRRIGRERAVVDFLKGWVAAHPEKQWTYDASADSAETSGILGSRDSAVRAGTTVGRIVSLLHADARIFRFEPVHLTMRTEASALTALSSEVGSYQGLATRAGILGTFIGLIASLGQVQQVFRWRGTELANAGQASLQAQIDGVRDEISKLMGEVVQGLALAFGTSIAGLVAAFVIFYLARLARDAEGTLARDIHDVANRVQKLFRDHTSQNAELVRTAEGLRAVMRDNLSAVADAGRTLHENASGLTEAAERLGSGLARPVQLFADNATALSKLLEQSAGATEAARAFSAALASAEEGAARRMDAVSAELSGLAERAGRQLTAAVEANGKVAAETAAAVSATLGDALRTQSREIVAGLGDKIGGQLQAEVLAPFVAGVERLERVQAETVASAMVEMRREARRQTRTLVLIAAMIGLVACASLAQIVLSGAAGFTLPGRAGFASSEGEARV